MRNKSNIFLLLSFFYAIAVFAFIANNQSEKAQADTNHVVISQIQVSGSGANDEFVELYNPTGSAIDLAKWRITRKSSTGGSVQNLVASLSGTIKPKSYYLISHPSALTKNIADIVYSSSASAMTTNNTVTLFSDAGITIVDKVGMGTAADVETAAYADNPEGGVSLVRKATTTSSPSSLFTGGSESTAGNGFDTDNNSADFVLFEISLPRNAASPAANPTSSPSTTTAPTQTPTMQPTPIPTTIPTNVPTITMQPTAIPTVDPTTVPTVTTQPTATPTQMPTVTPTSTPTPTKTPTPTQPVPTNTPMPTIAPTATIMPTKTPTPTTTSTPTPIPSVTIVPTNQPTTVPTMTPAPTMTPTPTPSSQVIVDERLTPKTRLVCIQTLKQLRILGYTFYIPQITCKIIRN